MALIPYEPMRQIENIRRELDRYFTGDFSTWKSGLAHTFSNLNADIHETDREIIATFDIPGLEKKEDVHIEILNNVLTISGTVNKVHDVKEEHMHKQERFTGRFQRTMTLPANVTSEGVVATYKNGVLHIRMPKSHQDMKKRIPIEFH